MASEEKRTALVVGAGGGLSAALARAFSREGMAVALAARDAGKLAGLCAETGARARSCDATDAGQVAALFDWCDSELGAPSVVVYNPSARQRGPVAELDPKSVADALAVTLFGGFLVGREAARRMIPAGAGAILFTGASASVKGYANSASFAMGKFGLRGLAQSMARELAPKGVHVAHFVIDGSILIPGRTEPAGAPDSMLRPDAIAQAYVAILDQPRSAWTWEVELRPWVENF